MKKTKMFMLVLTSAVLALTPVTASAAEAVPSSLMVQYNLHSRNISDPKKFVEISNQRLKYKADKNQLQAPLKLVLNSTYGVMKDKNNAIYDCLLYTYRCV